MDCKAPLLLLIWTAVFNNLNAQAFTSFFTGDTTDFVTNDHQAGILLAGGGPDSDAAMRWLVERAGGGDVLVMRASGSDGYNDYLYSTLGVNVNSVETILFNDASAAYDDYVLRRISEAEAVFFAGGNQTDYVNYWQGTPVQTALNQLITEKGITIGGTSAGMAILGGVYYAPSNQSLISIEALSDPFHPNTAGISNDQFITAPYLQNTITDTHFEQRSRQGRSLVFLARAMDLVGDQARGISANEASALAIDKNGIGRAFGEYPAYEDFIFMLAPGCNDQPNGPESMQPGAPIVWNREGKAVSVYVLPANEEGSNTFDLGSWSPLTNNGHWEYWTADNQTLNINEDGNEPQMCQPSNLQEADLVRVSISPQPVGTTLNISGLEGKSHSIELSNINGQQMLNLAASPTTVDVSHLASGLYFLKIRFQDGSAKVMKLLKQN